LGTPSPFSASSKEISADRESPDKTVDLRGRGAELEFEDAFENDDDLPTPPKGRTFSWNLPGSDIGEQLASMHRQAQAPPVIVHVPAHLVGKVYALLARELA
jgi:hypothetical protein